MRPAGWSHPASRHWRRCTRHRARAPRSARTHPHRSHARSCRRSQSPQSAPRRVRPGRTSNEPSPFAEAMQSTPNHLGAEIKRGQQRSFRAISTTTLLDPVSLSARQRPCVISESPSGTFPRMQHARNTLSARCPLILGEVLNLREKFGDRFLLPIARHHPDYSHSFKAPQIAATDSGSPVDRRPNPPPLG